MHKRAQKPVTSNQKKYHFADYLNLVGSNQCPYLEDEMNSFHQTYHGTNVTTFP